MYRITRGDMEDISREYLALWSEKNKQYGGTCDRLHEQFGDVYFDIMLQQKLNRIAELGSTEATFESKYDSIIDLMGYAMMYACRLSCMDKYETEEYFEEELDEDGYYSKEVYELNDYYNSQDWTDRRLEKETLKNMINLMKTVDAYRDDMSYEEIASLVAKIKMLRDKYKIIISAKGGQ